MNEAKLTEKEYAGIGKVAQEWARLEMQIHQLIGGMLGNANPHNYLVGPAMGAKLGIQFAAGLSTLRFTTASDRAAVARLMKRADGLSARRNTVVHSAFVRGKTATALEPLGIKVRATINDLGQALSEKAFLALAAEIHALSGDVWRFAQAHGLGHPVSD